MKGANTGRRRRAIISSIMTPIRGSLAPFLDPASVAVVGASRDPFKGRGGGVAHLRPGGLPGRPRPGNLRGGPAAGVPAGPPAAGGGGGGGLGVVAGAG